MGNTINLKTSNLAKITLTSSQQVPVGITFGVALQYPTYAITIQNSQSDPTPSSAQILLNLNLQGVLPSASVDNLLSLMFCQNILCSPQLYAWIESYSSDLSSVNVWVLLQESIPANSSVTIFMVINGKNNYPYTGIAPQLTPTYAQYDNGANVFTVYQAFGGLSSLPSGWTETSDTTIEYEDDYIVIEPDQTASGFYGIYLSNSVFNQPFAFDFYGNMYNTVNTGAQAGSEPGNAVGPTSELITASFWNGYVFAEGYSPTYLIYLGNDDDFFAFSTGYDDTNENKIYTAYYDGTYVNMQINYNSIFSTNSATAATPSYFNIFTSNNGGSTPSTPITAYWMRGRAFLPNGVMPQVVTFVRV